jgi:hypothetical protein
MKSSRLLQREPGAGAVRDVPVLTGRAGLALAAERKARLERALAETRKAREQGSIVGKAREAFDDLDKLVSGLPEPGPPGVVKIRLVGVFRERQQSLRGPLPGASVRLRSSDQVIAASRTDALGTTAIALPDRRRVDAEIQVVGTNGAVLVKDTLGSAPDDNLARVYELAPTDALAGSFDRARRWADERQAAGTRLEEASQRIDKALARQEEELIKLIDRADKELGQPAGEGRPPAKPPEPEAPHRPPDAPSPGPKPPAAPRPPRPAARKGKSKR